MSNDLPDPDPISLATARQAEDERRTRAAKIAGAELVEACLMADPASLPRNVRLKRQAVMELVAKEEA